MSEKSDLRHSAGSRRSVVAGSADVSAFGKCTTMHGKSHLCTPGETVLLVGRTRYVEEDALRRGMRRSVLPSTTRSACGRS